MRLRYNNLQVFVIRCSTSKPSFRDFQKGSSPCSHRMQHSIIFLIAKQYSRHIQFTSMRCDRESYAQTQVSVAHAVIERSTHFIFLIVMQYSRHINSRARDDVIVKPIPSSTAQHAACSHKISSNHFQQNHQINSPKLSSRSRV